MTTIPPPKSQGSSGAARIPGGGMVRPMYGIFIRDELSKFRAGINTTLDNTKLAIAQGNPTGPEVFGDGVLQGTELKKAKAAVKDLEKALKALKPVFGDVPRPAINPMPGSMTGSTGATRPSSPGGMPIAMYGVVFRDDLSRFRDGISGSIRQIEAGLKDGALKPKEAAEAKKAVKYLKAALADLNRTNWPAPRKSTPR